MTLATLERDVREGRVSVTEARRLFATWVSGKCEFRLGQNGDPEECLTNARTGAETWRAIPWLSVAPSWWLVVSDRRVLAVFGSALEDAARAFAASLTEKARECDCSPLCSFMPALVVERSTVKLRVGEVLP